MKFKPSAFSSDKVELNFWDIVKLLFGLTVKDGACEVSLWKKSSPKSAKYFIKPEKMGGAEFFIIYRRDGNRNLFFERWNTAESASTRLGELNLCSD